MGQAQSVVEWVVTCGGSRDYPEWPAFEAKCRAEGLNEPAIAAFKYNYGQLASGANLMMAESSISAVDSLPSYDALSKEDSSLLSKTVVLKLNGGLGTGMGLEKAKSLLKLKGNDTFLDFIAKQVMKMRETFGVPLAFMLMNSFSTSKDTLDALAKYPSLPTAALGGLEFQQNKAPKVDAADLSPAAWPANPSMEWCPPGHGDLYPALLGSGTLDRLLAQGFKYMFVSNSDNLGATMDLKLLTWFAESRAPFAMECAQRTDADKKGGHLCKLGSKLALRESAQCPDEDENAFQDVTKHKYASFLSSFSSSCMHADLCNGILSFLFLLLLHPCSFLFLLRLHPWKLATVCLPDWWLRALLPCHFSLARSRWLSARH